MVSGMRFMPRAAVTAMNRMRLAPRRQGPARG